MLDKLVYQTVPWTTVCPKILINAFPKAGMHMAEQMISALARPARNPWMPQPWVGNIGGNGFWNVQNPQVGTRECFERLGFCMPAHYLKAHAVHTEMYANFLNASGYAVIFMYRDLRDVAVSWAYHILDLDHTTLHPAKQFFQLVNYDGGFGAVLEAVIDGVDPLPGVIEHWEDFAPWLDEDWVLHIRYEDMRNEPEQVAQEIFFYLLERTCENRDRSYRASNKAEELYEKMADETRKREQSATFRRGVVGGWKDEFTMDAALKFVEHGGHDWLVKLGYE